MRLHCRSPTTTLIRLRLTGRIYGQRPPLQHYSTVVSSESQKVLVPVGSNGTISLDIHNPPHPSRSTPFIIFLPRGKLAKATNIPKPSLTPLAWAANATIIRINYRLSPLNPYPGPIHDVLAGYDWILKHLVRGSATDSGSPTGQRPQGLGICGELLGGSLAAMLALTECHAHKTGIQAVALGNPITDWTAFFPNQAEKKDDPPPQSGSEGQPLNLDAMSEVYLSLLNMDMLSLKDLLHARALLFKTPAHYFDPFASPLLFFRTASSDPPNDPHFLNFNPFDSSPSPKPDVPLQAFIKKRRAHKRHPPMASGLRLPDMRLQVGKRNILREQAVELAEMVRRSVVLHEGKEAEEQLELSQRKQEGLDRVEILEEQAMGLWGEKELVDVGRWFSEKL